MWRAFCRSLWYYFTPNLVSMVIAGALLLGTLRMVFSWPWCSLGGLAWKIELDWGLPAGGMVRVFWKCLFQPRPPPFLSIEFLVSQPTRKVQLILDAPLKNLKRHI